MIRKNMSINLQAQLWGDLERRASRCNMTLNSLVEELLLTAMDAEHHTEALNRKALRGTSGCGLSDEELEAELASYPSLDDTELKELSSEDFHQLARQMSHKPIKGVEKWL